jgi:hypothetical protein
VTPRLSLLLVVGGYEFERVAAPDRTSAKRRSDLAIKEILLCILLSRI